MSGQMIEALESRTLMSASPAALPSVEMVGKVLRVSGTAESDMIGVGVAEDGLSVFVQVSNNNGMATRTFPRASVGTVVIEGGAGDDMLIIEEAFGRFVPALLIGGSGSDVLIGGSSGDVLIGDFGRDAGKECARSGALAGLANGILNSDKGSLFAGDDVLIGDGGDDFLYGGAGSDVTFGGNGDDFLDGGTGSNILIDDAGRNRFKAGSATDLVICNSEDLVDAAVGATVLAY
jgi:Ca2+-binding RTX toxin-like protein